MAEYIEREAVLKHLRECEGTPPEIGYTYPIFKALECFVEDVPAADVAPVVHGRWNNGKCTVCPFDLRELTDGENDLEQWVWDEGFPYCPKCGARMQGGSSE